MSENIQKINDLFGKNLPLSSIDYFLFGYVLSSATIKNKQKSPKLNEEILKKILYINDLFQSNILSLSQKLHLYQEILDTSIEKVDYLIEKAMDQQFNVPQQLEKIESQEEHKLSEDYIKKIMEEDERRKREESKATEELLKNIMEEEKNNQEVIRQMKELQENENINCSICLSSLFDDKDDVWGLRNCHHCFHKICLNPYLEGEVSNKRFPIKCPLDTCKVEIANEDLLENMEKDMIEKYWDFTLKNYVDVHGDEMSWCPTADCNYAFIFDPNVTILNCPKCRKSYCLQCRVEEHKGMTCKEYQISSKVDKNDKKFFDFVKGHKFKQCTQCKFWVEKNEGCDHMTCRCGYQFCYRCGGKYQECECVRRPPQPIPIPVPRVEHPGRKRGRGKR